MSRRHPREGDDPRREARDSELVDDLLSGDERRVLHAVWAIFATRDPAVLQPVARSLARIERATDDLDLGGALISNRRNLDHAFDRVRRFTEGKCLCGVYPGHVRYEPAKEERHGHVRIVEEIEVLFQGRPDRPRRICECTACGRRFDVEEGEYHYTWWQWHAIAAPTPQADAKPARVIVPRSPARARRRRSSSSP